MADYAPNYTGRYRVRYSALGQTHAMTFRVFPGGGSLDPFVSGVAAFLDALSTIRTNDWTVLGADYAGVNSDLFLPASPPLVQPGTGGVLLQSARPVFGSYNGRSAGGSKCRVYIYGINQIPTGGAAYLYDYRILSTELPSVSAAVVALGAIPGHVGIDREPASWYPYMNIALNSYYQRKQRG